MKEHCLLIEIQPAHQDTHRATFFIPSLKEERTILLDKQLTEALASMASGQEDQAIFVVVDIDTNTIYLDDEEV